MSPIRSVLALIAALPILGGTVSAAEPGTRAGSPHPGSAARTITIACDPGAPCRPQAAPGPADRAVSPFEGSLGRPCAYRRRATPEGTRKVRVCF